MKTKEEIFEKVSSIIDNSQDEQIVLNACNFLYLIINSIEMQEKMEKEKEESKQKAMKFNQPLAEMLKSITEA